MEQKKLDMTLYAVTDRRWLGHQTLEQQIEEAIQGGVTLLQLREKNCSEKEFLEIAKKVKIITDAYQIPLIINDNVEVAIACEADGVHVGQGDMKLKEVRRKIGKNKIIGVSAKTLEQAKEAQKEGADYLGVGAVFPTTTKTDTNCISIDTIKEICKFVTIPVVAIGGIQKKNMLELDKTGIDGIAVVSAIFAANNIKETTMELKKLSQKIVVKANCF